ncbi:flagellar biosynthesis protein FlhB [bacterium]|nr:flagellar biosynthesis protein FlhB [bacterium]
MFDRDSRTEKPTPRRRTQAREKGSVARSQDLNSAVVLLGAAITLTWLGSSMVSGLGGILKDLLKRSGRLDLGIKEIQDLAALELVEVAEVVLPFLVTLMLVGFLVNVLQVGFQLSWKAAAPNWSRLNPMSGFKRFFSTRAVVELCKSLLKLGLVGLVLFFTLQAASLESSWLFFMPKEQMIPEMGRKLDDLFRVAAFVLLAIGIIDYLYQRYDHERSLKMTKEEVKEEAKQQEGDPKVKSKIREIMIRSTLRRMMKSVPEADVIITNPTHIAVALKYDRHKSSAPVVVAKGARKVAERIKEVAAEHGVPIVENKPLARTLFKSVDVGMEIPVELYKAVAEILAYVYRIKRRFVGVA